MTLDEIRRYACTLPGVTEAPHFERTSFRAGGKILATAPSSGTSVNLFVEAPDRDRALALDANAFEILTWGNKTIGVTAHLDRADPDLVYDLLRCAWRRRAPKRLVREYDNAVSSSTDDYSGG